MDHSFSAEFEDVRLRPLNINDIEYLRKWRNDKSKTKFLSKLDYITPEKQLAWFRHYLNNNDEAIFAIEEKKLLNRVVGSIALYDILEGKAEIGKLQIGDDEAIGKGLGKKSVALCMQIAFKELKINKLILSVNRENIVARSIYFKLGFCSIDSIKSNSAIGGIDDIMEINLII